MSNEALDVVRSRSHRDIYIKEDLATKPISLECQRDAVGRNRVKQV